MSEMLAVLESGGKQYIAQKGKVLFLEKLDAVVGQELIIDKVKMLNNPSTGIMYNTGRVVVELLEQKRSKKLIVFRKKRRKNSRRKLGHRQHLSVVRVKDVLL